MSLPPVPQRPLPPVHHAWVAGPGDGRRLYRTTLIRSSGLRRLGILWALCLASVAVSVVLDPSHNLTWLVVAILLPVLFGFLLWQRSKAQEAIMAPGSVWATGFGANVSATYLPLELFPPDAVTFLQQRTAQST